MDTDRFELRDQIGAGSMGSVYRVLDRLRGQEVALKALRAVGPNALYRFKREFRELCDLCHPNLVALHELYVVEDEWMFTMELVEGVRWKDWVTEDPRRLRDALVQLADGLCALHATGRVHRDLKPSNVLVTADGRVVIVDFGLVSDITKDDLTHEHVAVGTPGYMSPEQAADVPVSAATDWYAVGVMLYEVLTGRKPFAGPSAAVLLDKQRFDAPSPRAAVPEVPADLDALCSALLARDPRARPGGEEVLARLGAKPSPWTRRIADRAHPPVVRRDRGAELATLHAALADSRTHPVIVEVTGRRGAGRSALLETFAREIEDSGEGVAFLVRIGRREDVPFRGLDQLVDCITRYLIAADPEEVAEILPGDLESLARLFPTMQRLRAARLPETAFGPIDPKELGARAFAAVIEMLSAIAARHPLVLLLDDIHHGNKIGAATAFRTLTAPDAPRMLMVTSYPSEQVGHPIVALFRSMPGDRRVISLA